MSRSRKLLACVFLYGICVAASGQTQWTSSQDPLGVAMDEARAELLIRKSWAKDIPPVADVRRKGGTLAIGIGTPDPQDSTQWKAWWEQTICEAPELKKILLINGGVLVFAGSEPNSKDSVFYNRASCYKRIPDWDSREGEISQKEPYKVAPTKPTQSSKPSADDPLGLVSTFAKLNDIVVENQLRTAEQPETAARIATFKKNLYSALRKEGFSKTDAVSIVNSTPIPSLWR